MIHFASLQTGIKLFFKAAARFGSHKNTLRALLIALLVSTPLFMPRSQQAQDDCSAAPPAGCYTQPKRDIAFLIDATGSVEQRGQTYNIQVEGVRRAISDPTVIPRDGSVAVAVIVFNEAAQVAVPLTDVTDEATAKQIAGVVESLKCGDIHSRAFPCPFGATLYAPAIMAADIEVSRVRNASPKPGVTRAFVLSSDGLTNDLGASLKQVETARVASVQANIPFELDFIVLGEDQQSPDFSTALGTANELVTPKPANDLPGESFVITAGTSNLEGASATDPDIARQTTDFAETVRKIVRGQVATVQPTVNSEADTAPGTAIVQGSVSLRQAIELANCNGGATNITFAASLKDKTIHLSSPLPAITAPDVTINGCTIVDGNCVPSITIDGGHEISDGIVIRSNRVLVRGIKITNFAHAGVVIAARCPQDAVGHNRIEQNVIDGSPNGIVILGDNNLRNKLSQNAISRPTPAADAPAAALIDLGGDGPTANDDDDSDSGPNTLLNFPDAMFVTAQDNTVTVRGLLDNPPASGATVEIFGVTRFHLVDNHIVVDGVTYLGQTAVNDKGEFAAAGLAPSPTGIYTATVTDAAGSNPADQSANTSELMIDTADSPLPHSITDVATTLAFGDVTLNTPVTKPVTINNPGSAPLKVTGCTIGRCPNASSDNRERFAVANCPTAVINPGQTATVNVTVNATACGALTACLLLQTDDPRNPQVAVQLTANATSPAKAVIQDGVTQLKFKRQPARGTANPNPPTKTFTITNTGCQPLVINAATFTRDGHADTSGVFKISPAGQVTIPPGGSQTFTVSFAPVIPPVGDGAVPASINDTLTITTNTTPVTLTVLGAVKPPIRFINPTDPSAQPVVTLCKNGDEFIVTFSAYDSNTNLSRAVYQFKDSQGRNVGAPISVDNLGSVLQQQGIQQGQSFTLTQRFTGANDNKSVATVEVTIFDGETSDTATSTPLGSNCSGGTLQSRRVTVESVPALVPNQRKRRP